MKFLVLSTTVTDIIFLHGSSVPIEAMGGAGSYALAGMKVWEDDVGIVARVGADYGSAYEAWYRRNSISMEGLKVVDARTPRNIVRYREDGERSETPEFGKDHYRAMYPAPEDLEPHCGGLEGVYVFRGAEESFWKGFLDLKARKGFRTMWEIGSTSAVAANLARIIEICGSVEVLSINMQEARTLLSARTRDEVAEKFGNWPCAVFLRDGAAGSSVLRAGNSVSVASVPGAIVIDQTGGGNSSSGGAFVGFCNGLPDRECAAMGNISAAFCIAQHGVPGHIGPESRSRAERLRDELPGFQARS